MTLRFRFYRDQLKGGFYRLGESRLLAPSGHGGVFTQPRAHLIADPCIELFVTHKLLELIGNVFI